MALYKKISTATTNEATIKSSPGTITGYYIVNASDFFRFVKLFDATSPPTLSVSTPKLTLGIPAKGAANVALHFPLIFNAGITIAMVTGISIGATGAVGANELAVNIYYT